MSGFTERQAAAWPEAVAEAQRYVDSSTIPEELHTWLVDWAEESRPGRGHHFAGVWCDGEYLVEVRMDVYGYPTVAVAETRWLHNSANEECDCDTCTAEREAGR